MVRIPVPYRTGTYHPYRVVQSETANLGLDIKDYNTGRYVSVHQLTGKREPPTTGLYCQVTAVSACYHAKSIGNGRFRPLSANFGSISRGREKEEEEEEKSGVLFAHVIRHLRVISSPRMGRRNISPCGEKERDDVWTLGY
ncbi:hypothetical protein BHE74_00043212 [Ensete ventricosum]|nr:hypothetical protein BHE74_00043212 [Ensete ventricosum]